MRTLGLSQKRVIQRMFIHIVLSNYKCMYILLLDLDQIALFQKLDFVEKTFEIIAMRIFLHFSQSGECLFFSGFYFEMAIKHLDAIIIVSEIRYFLDIH